MTKDKDLEFFPPCQIGIAPALPESLTADLTDLPGQPGIPVIKDEPVNDIVKGILHQTADGRVMDLRSIFIHILYQIQQYFCLKDIFLLQSSMGKAALPDPIMVQTVSATSNPVTFFKKTGDGQQVLIAASFRKMQDRNQGSVVHLAGSRYAKTISDQTPF